MKTARLITRRTYLLGGALLIGCADSGTAPTPTTMTAPTAPSATEIAPEAKTETAPKPKLDLSKRPDFDATVVNVVTYRDKDGKVHKRTSSQKVRASFKGGTARATVKVAGAGKIGAAFAAMARDITTEESLTPVLAVLSGVLAYDYEETLTDEKGNLIQVFASAPSPNTPITDAWVFSNGSLVGQYHSQWNQATGGYTLANQTLGSYTPSGSLAGTIVSTVTTGGGGGGSGPGDMPQQTNRESFEDQLGALPRLALNKAICWLAPQTAFAADVPCVKSGLMLAGETYVLGIATTSGVAFAFPYAYFAGWGLWTTTLYDFLECVDNAGHKKRRGGGNCQKCFPFNTY